MTAKYVLDEIEKCIPEWPFQFVCAGYFEVRDKVWKLRKQLEEEEVDINKEISQFIDANFEKATIGHKLSLRRTAKHFFELGLRVQEGE